MQKSIRYLGLDVHAETIAVAVCENGETARSLGVIPNQPNSIAKLVKRLGPAKSLRVCYEAGPCGYVLYWQLTRLGVHCEVVAPTLVPTRAGDRVKTDRRDALKLARLYRTGVLTAVWVPDDAHEALRDLVRARESAKKDQTRARHRLSKFLLRHGVRPPEGIKAWTQKHRHWLQTVTIEQPAREATFVDYVHEVDHATERIRRLDNSLDAAIELAPAQIRHVIAALQSLRGVATVTSATIVAELGMLSRFRGPKQLMSYCGVVPREHSSGSSVRRGAITKTGNAHLRRVLGQAAWNARYRPLVSPQLRKRQEGSSEEIKQIAWRAQHRLHHRYRHLRARGKVHQKVVTALGRELLGFVWAVGVQAERELAEQQ